jgi:hypothetical protein
MEGKRDGFQNSPDTTIVDVLQLAGHLSNPIAAGVLNIRHTVSIATWRHTARHIQIRP